MAVEHLGYVMIAIFRIISDISWRKGKRHPSDEMNAMWKLIHHIKSYNM